MKSVVDRLMWGERALIVVMFTLMTAVSVFQVVNRNIFHLPIGWTEEVARYCQVWLALLGTQVGLRTGAQMSIQVLTSRLGGGLGKFVGLLADGIILAFCLIVFGYALDLMMVQIANGQVSSALKIPMTIPYAAMPFCFAMMSLAQIRKIFLALFGTGIRKEAGNV